MTARTCTTILALLVPLSARPLVAQQSREPPPTIDVRGTVVDHESGEVLRSAAVSLGPGLGGLAGRGTRVTDGDGRFVFAGVPTGAYRLSVTLLGYHAMADTLQVPAEGDLNLVLRLSVRPIPLEPLRVELEPHFSGYQNREQAGSGAFLITREEIDRRHPVNVTSLLSSVPGARVLRRSRLNSEVLLRGDCVPTIVVDGVTMPTVESIDRMVSPAVVETVEVYHGAELPVQYGMNTCGGVVITTRRGGPPKDAEDAQGGLWRYVGLAGLTALGVFMTIG